MLDKVLRISMLYDFYGALLTDKQRQCLEMHFLNDLSLSEIAEQANVSRQAIHDILKRAEQVLEDYEQRLGLVERYQQEKLIISNVYDLISQLPEHIRQVPEIKKSLSQLKRLLE